MKSESNAYTWNSEELMQGQKKQANLRLKLNIINQAQACIKQMIYIVFYHSKLLNNALLARNQLLVYNYYH